MIKETGKDMGKSKQILSVYNNNVLLYKAFSPQMVTLENNSI